jgi:putative transposase
VSRSGYYAWRERGTSLRQQEHERRIPLVREIHRVSKGTYGTRRMAEELEAHGNSCGRSRARTLMNLAQVSVRRRRKFKATTDSRHNLPVAPNLLDREFEAKEPNRVWVSDITYMWTAGGWLYLAVILDLFSRQVVGWSMNKRITKKLVIDALRMGVWRRRPDAGLIFHSEPGQSVLQQ